MIAKVWDQFLFERINVKQYAVLRIFLGLFTTLYLIQLAPLASLHFSPKGWLGATQDLDLYNSGSWSVFFWLQDHAQSRLFFICAIACSMSFTLGFLTRPLGLFTLISLLSIWNRNPLILDGDDAVLRITLVYLLLSPCGRAFSIDSLIFGAKRTAEIWPLRLIQFQLALIYLVSGWVKFHSPEWRNGTILQYVLIHPEYSRWDFGGIITEPLVVSGLGFIAFSIKWWELLFPLLVLSEKTRRVWLLIGLVFHLGLFALMNLRWFSGIMLTLYLAFIPNRYFSKLQSIGKNRDGAFIK